MTRSAIASRMAMQRAAFCAASRCVGENWNECVSSVAISADLGRAGLDPARGVDAVSDGVRVARVRGDEGAGIATLVVIGD